MVNHRIFPDTICYIQLWVKPEFQKFRLGIHLIGHSISMQIHKTEIENALVVFSLKHPAMIRFAEKRLAPFSTAFYESKTATKFF